MQHENVAQTDIDAQSRTKEQEDGGGMTESSRSIEAGGLDRNEADRLLDCALDIGEQMLLCGAGVSRVEDSITRICKAYGSSRVDVLTITASIIVTIHAPGFGSLTQTRRIQGGSNHLQKLHLLNQLSRTICETCPSFFYVEEKLKEIDETKTYSFGTQVLAYGIVSGSFTLFFGGNTLDMAASVLIGILLKYVETLFRKFDIYPFFVTLVCSAFGGLTAAVLVRYGFGVHTSLINLGNIMLLIPGIPMTNAIRDMFQGDTITGLLRFCEALLTAACVAFGFAATSGMLG